MISRKNNYEGFTGLEAAIVLIAFVVVAAVFSYVVLGAGFFTTQKSQEVVHTGVQQASSTLQIMGDVYGTGTTSQITGINFTIALAPGGTAVDVSKMVVTYSTSAYVETLSPKSSTGVSVPTTSEWGVRAIRNGGTDLLLEQGEQFDIGVVPTNALQPDTSFNLELKPIVGAALDIKRTAPAGLHIVNVLY
jgi:archaeal flagellin FlaB